MGKGMHFISEQTKGDSAVKQIKEQVPDNFIFSVMRILKRLNPGDTYLENYLFHKNKRGAAFFDHYHLACFMAIHNPPKRILEIGTRTGISLCQLLSPMLSYDDVQVFSFDLFNDGFISPELVKMNLRALSIPEEIVTFITGDSAVTVPQWANDNPAAKFDWILVDGCHEPGPARNDLENVSGLVAPGGVIVFDDISEDGMNLLEVWEEFTQEHSDEFEFYTNMDGKGTGWGVRL